ncbi:MAG: leucine-rich repeat domain-containing protein [Candidatus Thorarchaeota archaeon]
MTPKCLHIQELSGLTYLHISRNQITDLSALSGLTSLTFLVLHNNNITHVSPLAESIHHPLHSLPQLLN